MKRFVLGLLFVSLAVPAVSFAALSAPDVLDDESIMTDKPVSKSAVIGIRPFTIDDVEYENVDDEEMRRMKREIKDYQGHLAKRLKGSLEDYGFKAVILDEKDKGSADFVIEGSITMVNLGSAVGRIMFGFGAGQCGLGVEGSLVDVKTGDTLAKFEHKSTSGLDSQFDKWQMVDKEVREMADDIAEFVEKLK